MRTAASVRNTEIAVRLRRDMTIVALRAVGRRGRGSWRWRGEVGTSRSVLITPHEVALLAQPKVTSGDLACDACPSVWIDDQHVHTGVCADEELVTGGYDDPRVGWSAPSQLSDFAPPVGQVPETYYLLFVSRYQIVTVRAAVDGCYRCRMAPENGAAEPRSIGGAGVPHQDVAIPIPR